jgi:hypothetical protein
MSPSELKKNLASLLALQLEYVKLVEEESPDHVEAIGYYVELIEELKDAVRKNSIKYAKQMVFNKEFQQCLETPNGTTYIQMLILVVFFIYTDEILISASLYLPLLEFVQMVFRGHKYMATVLLNEHSRVFVSTMHQVTKHLKYAYETMSWNEGNKRSRSRGGKPSGNSSRDKSQKEAESTDPLYSTGEAKTIAELSAKLIKSVIDSGPDVLTFVILECPETTVIFIPIIAVHSLL